MSTPRRGRLAALAALTVVSMGTGVLAAPASAAPGVLVTAQAQQAGTTSAAPILVADGSKKWSKLGTVRTNGKGVFTKGFTAKEDGTWKAEFKATSSRLGATSSGDHVDVR